MVTKEAQDLFETFPRALKEFLLKFFTELEAKLPLGSTAVLIGSAARRELTWYISDNRVRVVGDVEFVILCGIGQRNSVQEITKTLIADFSKQRPHTLGKIEIDFGIVTPISKYFLVNSIWLFESQQAGVYIFGSKPHLKKIRQVTFITLDTYSVDYLVMVRLWNTFKKLAEDENSSSSIKEIYLRNILDALTVYLPRNGILVVGYRNRAASFLDMNHRNPAFIRHQSYLLSATSWKLNHKVESNFKTLQLCFLELFQSLHDNSFGAPNLTLLFWLRCKLMQFKLERLYFKRNFLRAFYGAARTPYNFTEKHIVSILLCVHRQITLEETPDSNDHNLEQACSYFGMSLGDIALLGDNGQNRQRELFLHLLTIMQPWFYGRSLKVN